MPYGKKRYVRKRKPQAWYDKKYSAWQLAKKAYAATRYIKGLVNSEMLYADQSFSLAISTTPTITHLTGIAQGDSEQGRTGNGILVRSISFKYAVQMHASAVATGFRIILLQDKQQVGDTAPTAAAILETTTSPWSLLQRDQAGRFKILYSRIHTLSSNGKEIISVEKHMKMYSHVRYNGSASTDVQKNGLYLVCLSDQATNTPTFGGMFRVNYHDN